MYIVSKSDSVLRMMYGVQQINPPNKETHTRSTLPLPLEFRALYIDTPYIEIVYFSLEKLFNKIV